MRRCQGLADLQVEKQNRIPQLRVEADHERAALYGITAAALTQALEGMSNGRTVSQVVTEGNRRFDVVIRLSDLDRSTTGLGDLLIATPSGHVPLRMVARIEETDGPNQIFRENGQRRIAVYANSDGTRDLAQIVADMRRVVTETAWPQGYTTRLEGSYQAQEEATLRIGILSLVSLAMIFIVLQSRYRSPVLALIIMGSVPLALIGSVAALWIAGQPLSVASMIGFVTLAGISTRNGILKISRYINLAMHEGESFGRNLVIRGSLERLAPVLLTALCAGLALTPLLLGAGEPGREILHPVAVTIFGGLLSSTLLDAVLTPILFLTFGRKPLERLLASRTGRVDGRPKRTSRANRIGGNRRCTIAFSSALLVGSIALGGIAHAQAPKKGANGGMVVVAEGHPIEFVTKDQDIVFYILDDDGTALSSKTMQGRAVVQDGGKTDDGAALAVRAEQAGRQARGPARRQGTRRAVRHALGGRSQAYAAGEVHSELSVSS